MCATFVMLPFIQAELIHICTLNYQKLLCIFIMDLKVCDLLSQGLIWCMLWYICAPIFVCNYI